MNRYTAPQGLEVLNTLLNHLNSALPVSSFKLRKGASTAENVLALDILITLYNALYGTKSHRKLRAYQQLLLVWPELKLSLKNPTFRIAAFMEWLDTECRAAERCPIPERELVTIPAKGKNIPGYCNPKFKAPAKRREQPAGPNQ